MCYAAEFGRDISEPQYQIAEWLDEHDDHPFRILQAYRESGKSDTMRLWAVWKLLCDPSFTVLIVSATSKIASRNSREIRSIIEKFSLTRHLKPPEPDQWQTETFTVNRPHGKSGDASVNCTSVTASNTGMHAHVLLGDDVEVGENTLTEDAREALWERIGSFQSLCTRQLFVGTPHHEDTIYNKLEALPVEYRTLKLPVYGQDGLPANPDVAINGWPHDESWIEMKRASMSPGKFSSQYLLIPVSTEESLFDLDLLHHYNEECRVFESIDGRGRPCDIHELHNQQLRDIAAYWDPAYGTRNHDDSVIAVAMRSKDGYTYLHDIKSLPGVTKEEGFDAQCEAVLDVLQRHWIDRVYVEENFAPTIVNDLKRCARLRGYRVSVIGVRRIANKREYIGDHIGPLINGSKLYVHKRVWKSAFKTQIKEFPRNKHDDHIDAVAGAIDQLREHRERNASKRRPNLFGNQVKSIAANTPPPL
jgi:predicted phage terminase large subunit-like protein